MTINVFGGGNSSAPVFPVQRSVRLRSSASAYFNRTPASAPTSYRKTTISFWAKNIHKSDGGYTTIYGQGDYNLGTPAARYGSGIFFVGGQFYVSEYAAGTTRLLRQSNALFRDPSAWYHFVISIDSTLPQGNNQCIVWCNNEQLSWAAATNPTQNTDLQFQASMISYIGASSFTNPASKDRFLDGYITEFYFIDGQALTPASFGSYNAGSGVWQPIRYTGTYGTNGFYLNFQDNSALTTTANIGIGKDSSGNGNYWTSNNISITAGITYDSMLDVPTNTNNTNANYAVMNPLSVVSGVVLAGGNLNVSTSASADKAALSTIATSSVKFYAEMQPTTVPGRYAPLGFGVKALNTSTTNQVNYYITNYSGDGPFKIVNGATSYVFTGGSSPYAYAANTSDIFQVACDPVTGNVWLGKNNSWFDSAGGVTGNPSTGANPTVTFPTANLEFAVLTSTSAYSATDGTTASCAVNFGQRPFTYTPPSGFKSLNTYNLPDSTIPNGATQFAATTYTGNSVVRNIDNTVNGKSFQPDLVWVKNRLGGNNHVLFDSVRGFGSGKDLSSNMTGAENAASDSLYGYVSGSTTSGFSVAGGTGTPNNYDLVNVTAATYVGWQWKAGGTAVTNTAGSITSQVSANPSAGFSIVTWTGTGASAATIGHGLNVAPKMFIIKQRNGSTYGWVTYHASVGAGSYLTLNTTNASQTDASMFSNTSPTSSVITLSNVADIVITNPSGGTMVAYCFSEIAGFSKAFSYTGNGSTDGVFSYLGFKPRMILLKRTDTTGNWYIWDTSRNTYNVVGEELYPNLSNAAATATDLDLLSNGFKLRNNTAGFNASGGTYIGFAWAENPFKNSLAR